MQIHTTNNMKKYNLELSEEELQLVMFGLGKLPAEQSLNLIFKVKEEYTKQNQPIVASDKDEE